MKQRSPHLSSVQLSAQFPPVPMRLAAALLIAFGFLGVFSPEALADNPVPFVNQPLVPDAVAPGGPDFTLTVDGAGFVSGSVVNWNGNALATQFVNGSRLTATVPAADIATASTASVTVVNPAPGGGTSNVALLPVSAPSPGVAFGPASSVFTNSIFSVATGDFNGDGKPDLAVTNVGPNTVSILLGDGRGDFTLASSPASGSSPYSLAVGDFNGDGRQDLAVVNLGDHSVSILLGDGTGNFMLASTLSTGSTPWSVAVGDFNGDGKLDLAVANSQRDGTVSILLGDGTGNFTPASTLAVGNYPTSLAAGDFNGDGKLDLAVVNQFEHPTVSILLGDGIGNFRLASSPATGLNPTSVAVADFNADGKLDLGVAHMCGTSCVDPFSGVVSILLGDGTGNFTLASSAAVGTWPASVGVGDFNADGKLDLAVTNQKDNTVSVLLGDGAGNFSLFSSAGTSGQPESVAVGDFNGDGKLDLAVADFAAGVSMLMQVSAPRVALSPTGLSFGTQLVFATSASETVTLTNTGTAELSVTAIATTGDFAQTNTCGGSVASGATCTVSVSFTPTSAGTRIGTITITYNAPDSPQTVSLRGTGLISAPIVTLSPTSLAFSNQALHTTSPAQAVKLTNSGGAALSVTSIVASGDFRETNNCGSSVASAASCTISVTFTPTQAGARTGSVTMADNAPDSPQSVLLTGSNATITQNPVPFINQPLVPDATAPSGPQFTLTVNGTGFVSGSVVNWNGGALATQFIRGSQLTATVPASRIATASTASVTVVNPAPGGGTSNVAFFTVTAPTSSVSFTLASSLVVGANPSSMAVGDFNGDGKLDLVVANDCGGGSNCQTGSVYILLGDGTGNFILASTLSPVTFGSPSSVAVGDFNGDGKLDLVVIDSGGVCILLGDGTGNFTVVPSASINTPSGGVAVGDFNGDGKLDLAVPYSFQSERHYESGVSILLGDGTGYFFEGSRFAIVNGFAAGDTTVATTVGDFNGDGKLDLAVVTQGVSTNTVSILLGDGAGNFSLASSAPAGRYPNAVAAADFNGDGKLDLAIANYDNSGTVSIFAGDGTGHFTLASSVTKIGYPLSMVVGDFNGDGKPDLAAVSEGVSILLGDGTGHFTLASSVTAYGQALAVGDFNGDGKLDLAVAHHYSNTVSILLQPSPGVALYPTSLSFGTPSSGSQRVTLTNTGTEPLSISSVATSEDFAQSNTCGSSVAAGASCTISVTFTPTASGTRTGTITITDNAPGSPQTVSLTGTATGPVAALSAVTMSMGGQVVGSTSAAHTLTLTNSGTTALGITSIAITNRFAQTNSCGASLAAGASCTIAVIFTPSTAGEIAGTLSITDNASGSPQQVSLSGVGQDFAIGFSPTTETVTAGHAAFYNLQISPLGGFNQTVALSCSGAPQFGSCVVSPASMAPANGQSPVSVSVKVTTRGASETFGSGAVSRRLPPFGPVGGPWLWLAALSAGILTVAARRRRLLLASILILFSVMTWAACGGGTAFFAVWTPGTPDGTFTVVVIGTSGPVVHDATTTLVVRGSTGPN